MSPENFGSTPPIDAQVDAERRRIAAAKAVSTRKIHGLEREIEQLSKTGDTAAKEIGEKLEELYQEKVKRNELDGLPPPPRPEMPAIERVSSTDDGLDEQGDAMLHRIGEIEKRDSSMRALDAETTQKNTDAWREHFGPLAEAQEESEALARAEEAPVVPAPEAVDGSVDGSTEQIVEEEKIEDALSHLVDQYEQQDRPSDISGAEEAADRIMRGVEEEVRFRGEGRLEDVRSRWQRMSQATRDATLLPIVTTSNWLARRPRWQKYAGAGLIGVLVYTFFDKNYGENGITPMGPGGMPPDAVPEYVPRGPQGMPPDAISPSVAAPENLPRGPEGMPPDMVKQSPISVPASPVGPEGMPPDRVEQMLPRPPAETEQSWMDKFREWLRGGSAMKGLDTATVGSEMVAPTSPEVVSGVFEHVVKKGDTVWSIVQHMLPEKFPASVFAKLGPEQVAYITDGLKDALERMTPQQLKELGISSGNIGKIFPGDTINFSKLFENQTLLNDLLEKARGLTQDQIQNIARNIRLGRM